MTVLDEDVEVTTPEEKGERIEKDTKKFSWSKDRIILAVIFVVIMGISIALLFLIIRDKTFLFNIVRDYFIAPTLSLSIVLRVLLFLGLMILQSLFAPIPSEIILLSGGMIFGLGWGTVIGIVGSMFSAAITYYLSKRGGRSIIDATSQKVKIIDRTIYIFDEWIRQWGLWAIILGRAIPMIMFDPISYAAGLVKIKDKHYFLATFIGTIPRAIFYAFLGVRLIGNQPPEYILQLTQEEVESMANQFNLIFFIIFGILVAMFALSNILYYLRERKKKEQKIESASSSPGELHESEEEEPKLPKETEPLNNENSSETANNSN
ncbi:MAG: hypothetical protein GF308_09745 [Candidatus Heimdallarchaeota archaeon]|nr:hypothetical protein [Candidatus Heimdallarchaeota archaeon]